MTISTKFEDLKSIELNALPVYNDRYIKSKTRTYGDKVCTSFGGINVPKDDVLLSDVLSKWYSMFYSQFYWFFILYENRYYLQVYLDNCNYKIVDKQMIDYLGGKTFETDED